MSKEIFLGRFQFEDKEIRGELTCDGSNSNLYVEGEQNFLTGFDKDYLHGYLKRNKLVTLMNCLIPDTPGWSFGRGRRTHFTNIFPHYILFDAHLGPDDAVISGISFSLTDGARLFPDHNAYGRISDPDTAIRAMIEAADNVVLGKNFEIYYSLGDPEIFECALDFGSLMVEHTGTTEEPGVSGISVSNDVIFRLHFATPVKFGRAISRMHSLRRMFGVLAGRPQTVQTPKIAIGNGENTVFCEVLDVMAKDFGDASEKSGINAIGMINGISEQELMRSYVQHWFKTEKDLGPAWIRFTDSFENRGFYSRDRLIAAANLFDLIPSSPKEAVADAALSGAIESSKALFKALSPSEVRDAALASLGRLTRPNLKTKVSDWNGTLKSRYKNVFGEIDLITGAAIELRNYYVHGTPSKHDVNRLSVVFLTKALEFSFVTGYLLAIGWDYESWRNTYSGSFQYFALFSREYQQGLAEVKGAKMTAGPTQITM